MIYYIFIKKINVYKNNYYFYFISVINMYSLVSSDINENKAKRKSITYLIYNSFSLTCKRENCPHSFIYF